MSWKAGHLQGSLLSMCLAGTLFASGCEYFGCGPDHIATLVQTTGQVERDQSAQINEWRAASKGDGFREGDAIRTRKNASANLTLTAGGAMALEENTLVRFARNGQGAGLDIVMGSATVHAIGSGLVFSTRQGDGQLTEGSKVKLSATGEGLVLEMLSGRGMFFEQNGNSRALGSEDRLVYDTQGALVSGGSANEDDAGVPDARVSDAEVGDAAAADAASDAGLLEARVFVVAGRLRIRSGRDRWQRLNEGEDAAWQPGLEVRVPRDGRAKVQRNGQTVELQGSGHYRALRASDGLSKIAEGRLLLLGNTTAQFPGGKITSAPDARALVTTDRRGTRITVTRGNASVKHGKQSSELTAGQSLALTRAGRIDEDQPKPPKRVHFFLGIGESVTVHDARAPTQVGFRIGDRCPEGAVVTVKRGAREFMSSAGEVGANVLMPPGRNQYEIKCTGGKRVAGGSVTVLRDSGRTALPRSAPPTLVDTDGRNYRVLYQNLLPEVTVRWRQAPSASNYALAVTTNGKTETFKTTTARYTFESGALREGQHRLVFSTGRQKSKPTNLTIRFDNAAPKARITSPYDRTFTPGSTVQVSGVALKGWKAYVGDQALSMDRQHRFTGSVQVPTGQDGVVVRLVHPGRGTHYYLRRAK